MAKKPTEKTAIRTDYQTPEEIFAIARVYAGGQLCLDPCTSADNPAGAAAFFAPPQNGLELNWGETCTPNESNRRVVWMNPPFSGVREWFAKLTEELARDKQRQSDWPRLEFLVLLPWNRSEQAYLQDFLALANAFCLVRGRVPFLDPDTKEAASGNPYNSWLLGLRVYTKTFAAVFGRGAGKGGLGRCFNVEPTTGPVAEPLQWPRKPRKPRTTRQALTSADDGLTQDGNSEAPLDA